MHILNGVNTHLTASLVYYVEKQSANSVIGEVFRLSDAS